MCKGKAEPNHENISKLSSEWCGQLGFASNHIVLKLKLKTELRCNKNLSSALDEAQHRSSGVDNWVFYDSISNRAQLLPNIRAQS